ncbi:hypothetical protein [Paraburkholderia sp. BL17N1]|uniref:hypothetical protein n=1 Tax=Paraburkholderia sp. BL17N1 TaxID=1938798 RepID=UPI000EADAE33|nr:hypothetical protein [Paraburkholderia sp. BL17N1]RKR45166.1 hypothetical protein B0G82_2804 [Paraburkholderia sp. BL17N1]
MKRFVEGDDRKQVALLPECVDDCIVQDNPVRVIISEQIRAHRVGAIGAERLVQPGWKRAGNVML